MGTNIRPFSNGTEFLDWQNGNCCRCMRIPRESWTSEGGPTGCDIFKAIMADAVTPEIAAKLTAESCGDLKLDRPPENQTVLL